MVESPRAGRERAPLTARQKQVLALVCVGVFMGALDGSIVNVAFPTLSRVFSVRIPAVGWVSEVYLLTTTALVTIFGRLSERWGNRTIYLTGFAGFLIGSALSGAAGSFGWLVAFRAFQAVGASMLVANSVAILAQELPRGRLGTALGVLEASVSAALVVGPALGGVLIQALGWRWIFYVNVPVALGAMGWAARLLAPRSGGAHRAAFDWGGTVGLGMGLGALLWGINALPTGAPLAVWLLPTASGALMLGGLVWWENQVRDPMLDLNLFRRRAFAAAAVAKVFAYATMFAATLLVPFYLQDRLGFRPAHVGALMVPMPVALAAGSLAGGPASDRVGSRLLAPLGLVVAMAGTALFSWVSPGRGVGVLVAAGAGLDLGLGAFIVANDRIIMHSAPPEKAGTASGVLAMMRSIGMVLGLALGATAFAGWQGALVHQGWPASAAFVAAFHWVLLAAVGALGAGLSLTLVPPDPAPPLAPAKVPEEG
ncbi:MAG: MFS transporter [Firmicutes bacterium]|nr:MFS transporter [Alicyclobacillaceae bacterium]MCL6498237.1 MFS transporter [Bacillota bacterium]